VALIVSDVINVFAGWAAVMLLIIILELLRSQVSILLKHSRRAKEERTWVYDPNEQLCVVALTAYRQAIALNEGFFQRYLRYFKPVCICWMVVPLVGVLWQCFNAFGLRFSPNGSERRRPFGYPAPLLDFPRLPVHLL
jgi:hypothetical protein